MAGTETRHRPSAGVRRLGYGIAVGINAALLVVLNGWPGWQTIPFLTSSTGQVIWLVNFSLAAGIAANLVYMVKDTSLVKSLGDLTTTAIALAATIRIWQVFPFDLSSGWSTAVRVLLVVTIVGACAGLLVNVILAARSLAGHSPGSGHVRTGH